jgi:hypothetical protein
MEIKTLVIIGFILTLLSSGLYFYIHMDSLMNVIKLTNKFKKQKTIELKKIDANVSNELKKIDANVSNELKKNEPNVSNELKQNEPNVSNELIESDLDKLKKELEALKKSMSEKTERVEVKTDEKKEVFLVSNNIFSKSDSSKVCKGIFNSDVATKEQLNDSFNNGANWCNYGWTSEGEAYYPLQNETNNTTCKGGTGLNGGIMAHNNYSLGVLCYGVKPNEQNYTDLIKIKRDSALSDADQKLLENYHKKLENGTIKIAPFNDKSWSRYSYKNDTLSINDKVVVTSKKESSNDPQALDTNKSKIQTII